MGVSPVSAGQRITAAMINGLPVTWSQLTTGSGGTSSTGEVVIGTFQSAMPANDPAVGFGYMWRVVGTTNETGTPNITLRTRIDTAGGTAIVSHTAMTANQGNSRLFSLEGWMFFTAIGAGGAATADERVHEIITTTGNGTFASTFGTPSIDTTSAHSIVITAQFSASNAGNLASTLAGTLYKI